MLHLPCDRVSCLLFWSILCIARVRCWLLLKVICKVEHAEPLGLSPRNDVPTLQQVISHNVLDIVCRWLGLTELQSGCQRVTFLWQCCAQECH